MVMEKTGRTLLAIAAKSGDAANAKLAQSALENCDKIGVNAAYAQLARDCFKDDGKQRTYDQMRMLHG